MLVLGVLALLGSGTTAGVLFAVALSMVPALAAMPVDRYVYAHQMLGRHWDPTMPAIVLLSTVLDLLLAVFAHDTGDRVPYVVAAVALFGVSVVSHLCNVPINRRLNALDPADIPADWSDPRPVWRRWHLLRTCLAFVALAANASALALAAAA